MPSHTHGIHMASHLKQKYISLCGQVDNMLSWHAIIREIYHSDLDAHRNGGPMPLGPIRNSPLKSCIF